MNDYFSLYDLPVSFHPDPAAVKSKFYELSRRYHPDRFANADSAAQIESLSMAALNNAAYKTLMNPDATMAYILKHNNILEDEEKYSLPADFLMEMMDLNETISDHEADPTNDILRQQAVRSLAEQLTQWENEVGELTTKFDNGEQNKDLLLQVKDHYFRKKYLLRIQERIDRFAAHS